MALRRIIFKLGLGRRFYPEVYKRLVSLHIAKAIKQQRILNEAIVMQDLLVRGYATGRLALYTAERSVYEFKRYMEMRYHYTTEEINEAQKICDQCKYAKYNYCSKHKTDSIVFKVDRCEKLESFNKDDYGN